MTDSSNMPMLPQRSNKSVAVMDRQASARIRLRADLDAKMTHHQGRRYWLVRDPLARKVVRLTDADYRSLQHAEDAEDGLLAEATGQQLLLGLPTQRAGKSMRSWNPLYVRFPGLDPDRFLQWAAPRTRWLFAPQAIVAWLLVILMAVLLVSVKYRQFASALPSFHAFFGPQNWLPLAVTVALTKIVHELAHGVVCRRFGARCPEIGVLLLCGAPCMYCDVTDSWSLPSRWQRAAVMLAGVYVEAILAAVATWIWWCAAPGPVYFGCMNIMFVCGVSTLLFNLNPLMRFDGYYVLSDLINVPNMRAQAATAWQSIVVARLAGVGYSNAMPRRPRHAVWLAVFHFASTIWRVFAVGAIAIWIMAVARSARLLPLGYVLACVLIAAAVIPMFRKASALVRGDALWNGVNPMRRYTIFSVFVVAVVVVLIVPLPKRISANGIVDFSDASCVYVRSAGQVESVQIDFGQAVNTGQSILTLESSELLNQQIQLASQSDEAQLRIASLRRQALSNPDLMDRWDSHQATAASLKQRVEFIDRQVHQLSIRSPAAGVVLPVIGGTMAQPAHLQDLGGRYLEEGSKICRIGDPAKLVVIMEVDAKQRASIDIGTRVRVRFAQSGVGVVQAKVSAVSEIRQQDDPHALNMIEKFRVICELPRPTNVLAGTSVIAKVVSAPEPLYQRMARLWRESF